MNFPPCPPALKAIQHYLKAATEHDARDPAVSYWCRLYALNCGLKIDKKSKEALTLLTTLMDWLETQKKTLADNETVTNEVAAQAHVENYALQLFYWADQQDRNSVFNKNVVKSFYTAGVLFDVCTVFSSELSEELEHHRKYAKWKAAYIHNCLKNGETPIPGPRTEEQDELLAPGELQDDTTRQTLPLPNFGFVDPSVRSPVLPSPPQEKTSLSQLDFNAGRTNPVVEFGGPDIPEPTTTLGGPALSAEGMAKAQKYCKWASSALNYDDVPTAITNLEQALRLLKTGHDS